MPYQYNRRSFLNPTTSAGTTLLSAAYLRLVGIELLLKEKLPPGAVNHNNGHDIPTLLHTFASGLPHPHSASLQALSVPLANGIANLWCEGFNGHRAVPARSYPYMRYLRHDSEWSAPNSPDSDIQTLLVVIQQIQHQLTQATGVQL
jgi:hypothetical protein